MAKKSKTNQSAVIGQRNRKPNAPTNWLASLARYASVTRQSPESRIRTMISCDILSGKPSIYVPPDMAELQPHSLRYLHTFARQNELQLVEDRRRVSIKPATEKRNAISPIIVKAVSELLLQLGMPGDARHQSRPHRLSADSQHIDINRLIQMAAFAAPQAKRVLVEPNRRLVDILDGNKQPIVACASKLTTTDNSTVLSHFESPHFHGFGYSAGKQYVVHVCVAGGPLSNPTLWSGFHTLTRSDFQFQLFNAQKPKNDLGLIYATFYFDLADAPRPWWLSTWSENRLSSGGQNEPMLVKRTG